MTENQDTDRERLAAIKLKKDTVVGKEIVDKVGPKKSLNRKAADYVEKHVTVKTIHRFEHCRSWMLHLTNKDLSAKRLYKTDACGNRFCPICTWAQAKKDAIKLSVMLDAVKTIEGKEFLFLTLTAPNCTGEDLRDEIDRFNKAVKRLFERRNVERIVKGYVRKIEVTTDQEQYITTQAYKRKKDYFDMRGLKVGDPNPTFNTYNPHIHAIVVVNKSYFNKPDQFISNEKWLEMWRECMNDQSITQVNAKKVRDQGNSNAVLEIAKYAAKATDLYHSETVFDTFYTSLKGRQLLVYSGTMKDYAKKYDNGDLDGFKQKDETVYTHLIRSIWKASKYDNKLRQLSPAEVEQFNKRAEYIEEDDEVE